MRDAVRFEPLLGVDLVGTDDRADLVVEDLRRGARQRREAGFLRQRQVLAEVHAEPAGAFGHLERGEPVDVDVRRDGLHGPGDVQVVVAVEVRVDAALQAHLGRAALDRLDHPRLDLLDAEQVRVAAQVERERPLRERAEPALERADVRVVDVAVAHERDGVADDLAPQLVGHLAHRRELGPRAPSSVTISSTPTSSPLRTPSSTSPTGPPARRGRRRQQQARGDVAAARPVVVTGETFEVVRAQDREAHRRVEPLLGVADVLGVHGEPGRERLAGRFGRAAQQLERGPGPLRVHVVGGERRDPAPVVDPGGDEVARGRRASVRFGGACTCIAPPSTRRASAIAAAAPPAGHGGASCIFVPGFGRKFWTITSWT